MKTTLNKQHMTIHSHLIKFICIICLCLSTKTLLAKESLEAAMEAAEILELNWDDLRPKETVLWRAPIDDLTSEERAALSDEKLEELLLEQKQILHSVAVVHELNNRQVSMPGLVVPLEYEGELIKEFLLVPYHGACIHVPAPPLYQIVYVTAEPAFKIDKLFDTVKITGKMQTQLSSKSIDGLEEIVDVGYRMEAALVEEYIAP